MLLFVSDLAGLARLEGPGWPAAQICWHSQLGAALRSGLEAGNDNTEPLSHSATEAPLEDGGSEVTRPPQTTPEQSNRGERRLGFIYHFMRIKSQGWGSQDCKTFANLIWTKEQIDTPTHWHWISFRGWKVSPYCTVNVHFNSYFNWMGGCGRNSWRHDI